MNVSSPQELSAISSISGRTYLRNRLTRVGAQAQFFTIRFEQILSRKHPSDPARILQPILEPTVQLQLCLKDLHDEGVINDPVMRELYSYSRELSEMVANLRRPRHPNQLPELMQYKDMLLEQSSLVDDYFWHKMAVAFPAIRKVERSCVHLCWGWRVMIHSTGKCKQGSAKASFPHC